MRSGQLVLDSFLESVAPIFSPEGVEPRLEEKEEEERGAVPEGCCPQCYYATSPVCRCGCGGRYHGLGAKLSRLDEYIGYELIVDEAVNKLFEDADCLVCGESLGDAPIYGYESQGGVEIDGRRLWVFAVCPKCGYQNSLHKLMTIEKAVE